MVDASRGSQLAPPTYATLTRGPRLKHNDERLRTDISTDRRRLELQGVATPSHCSPDTARHVLDALL